MDDFSGNFSVESTRETSIGPLSLLYNSGAAPRSEPRRWPSAISVWIVSSVINAVIDRLIAMLWGSSS